MRLVDVLGGPDYEVSYPNGELSDLSWFTPGQLPGLQLSRFSRALLHATSIPAEIGSVTTGAASCAWWRPLVAAVVAVAWEPCRVPVLDRLCAEVLVKHLPGPIVLDKYAGSSSAT